MEESPAKKEVKLLDLKGSPIKSIVAATASFEKKTKTWVPILASIVALIASIWGLYVPVANYFEEKHRRYQVTISTEMIDKIGQINSDNKLVSDNAILMLSAYEMDAVPFLLYKLENVKVEDVEKRDIIIRSLQIISHKDQVDKKEIVKLIVESGRLFFFSKYNNYDEVKLSDQEKNGIYNYILLLGTLGAQDESATNAFFDDITIAINTLPPNEAFKGKALSSIELAKKNMDVD